MLLVQASIQSVDGVPFRTATSGKHLRPFGLGTHVVTRHQLS
ncbi:MAG: hypothetical protein P1V81_13275 [Planctomycetota bacterium]|nr:hypothetical protein [Planctomycetota bacterium]